MKLIKFKDGTYGIAMDVDFCIAMYCFKRNDFIIYDYPDEQVKTDKATAEAMLEQLTDRGAVG